jgi:hypothetical protein
MRIGEMRAFYAGSEREEKPPIDANDFKMGLTFCVID